MQKNLLYLLLVSLLIPQFALASWWNPLSWTMFSKSKPVISPKSEIVNIAPTSTEPISTTTQQKAPQKKSEKPPVNKPAKTVSAVIATSTQQIVQPPSTEQIERINKYCNLNNQAKEICASKNVVQMYISDIKFRVVMDQMMNTADKNTKDIKQKVIDQYIPSYAQKNSYYLPNIQIDLPSAQTSLDTNKQNELKKNQDKFNNDICERMGGMYVGGNCI